MSENTESKDAGKTTTVPAVGVQRDVRFNHKDVIILAEAILDEPLEYYKDNETFTCLFCGRGDKNGNPLYTGDKDLVIHSTDCPVLVARDVLTGIKT